MTNEELNILRTLFREEANTMRATVREEVNAAVYASETRLMERLGQVEGRLGQVEGRLGQVEGRLGQVEGRLGQVEGRLGQVEGHLDRTEDRLSQLEIGQQKLRVDFLEMVEVLSEASKVINEVQQSQHSLEEKFEDNILAIKREIQKLNATVYNFARDFIEMNGATNERITAHERTPFEQAHLRPHSAA